MTVAQKVARMAVRKGASWVARMVALWDVKRADLTAVLRAARTVGAMADCWAETRVGCSAV